MFFLPNSLFFTFLLVPPSRLVLSFSWNLPFLSGVVRVRVFHSLHSLATGKTASALPLCACPQVEQQKSPGPFYSLFFNTLIDIMTQTHALRLRCCSGEFTKNRGLRTIRLSMGWKRLSVAPVLGLQTWTLAECDREECLLCSYLLQPAGCLHLRALCLVFQLRLLCFTVCASWGSQVAFSKHESRHHSSTPLSFAAGQQAESAQPAR